MEIVATWRSPDTMRTVEKVIHTTTLTGCRNLAVDVGGPGGGVVDRLRQLGYEPAAVHFGGAADDSQRFRNWRAEAFWKLREGMERGEVSLPDDDELGADLSALRYIFTQDGRLLIENKDQCRRRLGHSPDRADAVALAYWHQQSEPSGPCFVFIGGQILDLAEGKIVKSSIGW
jgi:hypothetical protein